MFSPLALAHMLTATTIIMRAAKPTGTKRNLPQPGERRTTSENKLDQHLVTLKCLNVPLHRCQYAILFYSEKHVSSLTEKAD